MSGPLPFTGVSQAAQLMDHLTNLLWASWEEGKGEGRGVARVVGVLLCSIFICEFVEH